MKIDRYTIQSQAYWRNIKARLRPSQEVPTVAVGHESFLSITDAYQTWLYQSEAFLCALKQRKQKKKESKANKLRKLHSQLDSPLGRENASRMCSVNSPSKIESHRGWSVGIFDVPTSRWRHGHQVCWQVGQKSLLKVLIVRRHPRAAFLLNWQSRII